MDEKTPSKKKSSCGVSTMFLMVLLNIATTMLVIVDLLVSTPVDPEAFRLQAIPEFTGHLETNYQLQNVDKAFLGKIRGPESIAEYQGKLYSGLADGRIVEMDPSSGAVRTIVAALGAPPCGGIDNERTCGRPLGIRVYNGTLYAVDAYLGVFTVNIHNGAVDEVVSANHVYTDGRPALFLNDIEVSSSTGIIYVTDSSYKWTRADHCYVGFENRPYARLIAIDPRTKQTEILIQGMYFANGLQLSRDESYILITEMARSRVTKYYISGDRRGQREVLSDNLPGLPDNIRLSKRGYWVAFAVVRHPQRFSVWDTFSNYPWIRKLMAKIFHKNTIGMMVPRYCLAVELNEQGDIIRSLHDPAGSVMTAISEVLEAEDGTLYIGSYFMPFLGKLTQ